MDFMTVKVKIVFLVIIACTIGVALYRWWFKNYSSGAQLSTFAFAIPQDSVRKIVLDNGMHVLVFKNTAVPKVLVQIAYDVGSYVEESGERGLAHLVEHMIFKGTQKLSESDIDTIGRKYGASFNAFTSHDVTSYYFEVDKNNWKPFLLLLSDCMQNARFDEQHLASEIKAVIQELKMGKDNYWRMMILKACELAFPPNHPYHTAPIGFKEDLLELHADTLKKFYHKYYRPDRATLFIVGDVEFDDAIAAVREHFEPVVAEKSPAKKPFPKLLPELMTHHTRFFEDVSHDQLCLYWMIPGLKAADEYVPTALAMLLGGGQSSRLTQVLVDERKIASSVYVKASKFMEAGIFLVLIEPMPGKSDECMQLVKEEVEKLVRDGVTAQELTRVVKQKGKSFLLEMQNYHDFVYTWIQSYFVTHNELDVFTQIVKFQELNSDIIKAYAQTYLDPLLMSRIEVLSLPDSKKALREVIKAESDALDQKILARHQRTVPIEAPKAADDFKHPQPLMFQFPKPTKVFELPNGLKVIFVKKSSVPLIATSLQFKNSFFFDEAREGIGVEFMMDMLIEGSKGFSKKENTDFFETNGASYAFGVQGAHFLCLRDDFEKLAERFYHILTQPKFTTVALNKVKEIFVSNYQRSQDAPRAVAGRLLKNALYKNHPYAWTFDEAITLIQGYAVADLKKLHSTYVNPANMVLSVVGDCEEVVLEQILTKIFSSWASGREKVFEPTKPTFERNSVINHHMLRDQVMLMMGQPSPITIHDADLIPLTMLSTICFDSMGSRIYKVREQTGLFYTAFGAFAARATTEHGYDFMGMLVSPENVEIGEQKMREVLHELVEHGVTDAEIDAARQIYLKELIDMVSSYSAIARLMANLDSLKLGFDYYDAVLSRVQSMTREEMNTIAARYCSPDAMLTVRVGPVGKR